MSTSPPSAEEGKTKPLPLKRLPRSLFGTRWWWVTLLVIVGVAVLARLGIWQLDRMAQRRAQNAIILEQLSAPPLLLTGEALPTNPEELHDRPAIDRAGEYLQSAEILQVKTRTGARVFHQVAGVAEYHTGHAGDLAPRNTVTMLQVAR